MAALLLDRDGAPPGSEAAVEGGAPEVAAADRPGPDEDAPIRCAACGAEVTRARHRIDVHGAHLHRRVNPAGIPFAVACFAEARCAVRGEATLHWTWFPGSAWQVALCVECGAHLGWRFAGGTPPLFHGLIVDRLAG